jgi:hypothetical protein
MSMIEFLYYNLDHHRHHITDFNDHLSLKCRNVFPFSAVGCPLQYRNLHVRQCNCRVVKCLFCLSNCSSCVLYEMLFVLHR